jgi:Domain of unknown function (DUF4440)
MTARVFVAGVLLSCAVLAPAGPSTPGSDSEAELRRITQELMDAIAPGKADVWRRYLHESVVHLDENGVVRDKAALLKELTPLPAGLVGRIEVDRYQVKLHGDTAVAAGETQEYLDYHGQSLRTRFRFLDTWLRTREGWRLIAQHTSAVLKDPPAVRLTRDELCAYAGLYQLTPAITTVVRCTDDGLTSERTGRPAATYLAEVRDVFFVAGQPRTRRIFLRDANGKVVAFVDRREGEDVRWQRMGDAGVP